MPTLAESQHNMDRTDSPLDMLTVQSLSFNVDERMDPLDRDMRNYRSMLEWSTLELLEPANIDAIIGTRLGELGSSHRLPHTGNAIGDVEQNFIRARVLIAESRQRVVEAARLLDATMQHLAAQLVRDKQHLVERVVDQSANRVACLPDGVSNSDECFLCTELLRDQPDNAVAWVSDCHCRQPAIVCLPCLNRQLYASTNGGRRTTATCSFCRHPLDMSNVHYTQSSPSSSVSSPPSSDLTL